MTEIIIPSQDHLGSFKAYIATPEITPAPCIIMIQEIFGVNEEMRQKCDDMAAKGFVAISPDLFWRIEPNIQLTDSVEEELNRAFELFGEFDQEKGLEDLQACLKYLRGQEYCNQNVASVGYCLGGKLAFQMALHSDCNANVSYYGVGIETLLDKKDNIQSPLLMHIAEKDDFVPKEAQETITQGLAQNPHAETHIYKDMDHAFARINGIHYNKEAATLANDRTLRFLTSHLGLSLAA